MSDVSDTLARLADAPAHALRVEWRRHYRTDPPPSLSRDLLLRAIAYKVQERAHGSLSQTAKRAMQAVGRAALAEGDQAPRSLAALKPGVRLVREWGGDTHTVLVLQDGFEYRGERYRSLTQIAKVITGAHWSGPRFFQGDRSPRRPRSDRCQSDAEPASSAEADDGQA